MLLNDLLHGSPAAIGLILAALGGLLLGIFFFGGLWWTVRRTLSSKPSAFWQIGSLLVRMAVTLLGFYAVGAGQPDRLLACLAGFVLARFVVSWRIRSWELRQLRPTTRNTTEAGHAPQP